MKLILAVGLLTSVVCAESKIFDPYKIQDSNNLATTFDVLFWQASQDNLGFGIESKSTTSISHGHFKQPDFDWNWGFRAGVDYKSHHDKWDIATRYTYMHSTASESISAPAGGAVFPSWQFPLVAGGFVTDGKAHWICNLNMADLELGRDCYVGTWLSIRPFMGVRGAVVQQRYHVGYKGGTAVPAGDEDKIKMSNNFWGVGIRVGFNSLWGFAKGWSFYVDGAGSLLSGQIKVREGEHFNKANETIFNVRDTISTVIPTAEIALGLQWDHLWDNDRYHLGVKLGWEFNCFFNQNRLFKFASSSSPGFFSQNNADLSFQGVTLGLRFDF